MLWYIKTCCSNDIIASKLGRYLYLNIHNYKLNNKIKEYIESKYDISIKDIIEYLYKNLRVVNMKEDFHQIYILDETIDNKIQLSSLLNLLEYGNRDIPGTKMISSIINKSLDEVKDDLGGI